MVSHSESIFHQSLQSNENLEWSFVYHNHPIKGLLEVTLAFVF